jgi:reactive intermediate/imine deaminase
MTIEQSQRREIWVNELGEPISHFTHAVQFGDFLFISGCGPTDPDGRLVGGDDAAAQAQQVLTNIRMILSAAGMDFSDILKVTVYLTDIEDRARINPVRQAFFGSARPASTLVEVSGLAIPGMKVEIEAVAARGRR